MLAGELAPSSGPCAADGSSVGRLPQDVSFRQPDLLLLDEPVVAASHDRWLRARWDGDVLAV